MARLRFCDGCKRKMTEKEGRDPRSFSLGNSRTGVRLSLRITANFLRPIPGAKMGQVCEELADFCTKCALSRLNELLDGRKITVDDRVEDGFHEHGDDL